VALLKMLAAPLRRLINFPLFQLLVAIAVILWLQAADSKSMPGQIFNRLDWLVDRSVEQCAAIFQVRSFTKSWLTSRFMIAYVYIAGLIILFVAALGFRAATAVVVRGNVMGLRNSISRQRGIAAYRAWLPLEHIRPAHIAQAQWEETYAWPVSGKPPYPPLAYRAARGALGYVLGVLVILILLQVFTPFPALTWLGRAVGLPVLGG
jgi:hypothetical protein